MSVKYYSDQSVVEPPHRKSSTPEKKTTKETVRDAKPSGVKKERIAVINGKLAVVKK